jgi:hypothetical protein
MKRLWILIFAAALSYAQAVVIRTSTLLDGKGHVLNHTELTPLLPPGPLRFLCVLRVSAVNQHLPPARTPHKAIRLTSSMCGLDA